MLQKTKYRFSIRKFSIGTGSRTIRCLFICRLSRCSSCE
ncbi:YSIRK-type signal peptide-containing protein [Staphylococcus haemolyticus]|nr:YSIRK-type signal peptide-containing protein [Staphylococcus haemolyticus]MEB6734693.1 YSIRK-type signal peptide-containing protein [Staphylococcus haemolyticus]